jgi:hypothetical protein
VASEAGAQVDAVRADLATATARISDVHGRVRDLEAMVRRALVEQERESRRRFEALGNAIADLAARAGVAAPIIG